jgi:hypothetical protein
MKNKIILTETELTNLIKQVVIESNTKKRRISEGTENFFNPEALDTAEAIYTIIGTTVGMLGIAGYDVLKGYAKELMKAGKKKEAKEIMLTIKDMQSKGKGELGEGKACLPPRAICKYNNYCMPPAMCKPPGHPSTGPSW